MSFFRKFLSVLIFADFSNLFLSVLIFAKTVLGVGVGFSTAPNRTTKSPICFTSSFHPCDSCSSAAHETLSHLRTRPEGHTPLGDPSILSCSSTPTPLSYHASASAPPHPHLPGIPSLRCAAPRSGKTSGCCRFCGAGERSLAKRMAVAVRATERAAAGHDGAAAVWASGRRPRCTPQVA